MSHIIIRDRFEIFLVGFLFVVVMTTLKMLGLASEYLYELLGHHRICNKNSGKGSCIH